MKYAIKKDGKYLSCLIPNARFEESTPVIGKIYWYRIKLIAEDIARQLNAEVETLNRSI